MRFRHELKYLINEGDAALIRQRLDAALQPDAHALNGRYHIRSLYFDDYYDTAYLDKLGGFGDRRKYRIRIYNLSDQVIRLEGIGRILVDDQQFIALDLAAHYIRLVIVPAVSKNGEGPSFEESQRQHQ